MSTTPVALGKLSPRSVTEGKITCTCGYEGQPLEVTRWALLETGWLGLCPCGSSCQVEPRRSVCE